MPARPGPDSRAWEGGLPSSRRGVDVMMERGGVGVWDYTDSGFARVPLTICHQILVGGLLVDAGPFSLMKNAKAWLEMSILPFLITIFS